MTELVCIVCPKGCRLQVDEANNYAVSGAACAKGAEYGREELRAPVRAMTSTVKIAGGLHRRLPVKSDRPIAKRLIPEAVSLLNGIEVTSPVRAGDIILQDVLGTGMNVISTRNM